MLIFPLCFQLRLTKFLLENGPSYLQNSTIIYWKRNFNRLCAYAHEAQQTNAKEHVAFLCARDGPRVGKGRKGGMCAVEDGLEYLRRGARQAAFNIFDKVWAFESVDARLVNPRPLKLCAGWG